MKYDVDYFIEKFEAIPESMWLVGDLGNHGGPRCALGHTIHIDNSTNETQALCMLFPGSCDVLNINNGSHPDYQQSRPKQRILAALNDIKISQVDIDELRPLLINHKNLEPV